MNRLLIISTFVLLSGCYLSDEVAPDQAVWDYAQPNEVGLSNGVLKDLDQAIKNEEYGFINGLTIVRNDQLVFENYYTGGNRESLFSIGRNSVNIAIFLFDSFISAGLINSIDVPIYTYLEDYENIFNSNPDKKLITFRHLLLNKSGLVWNESIVSSIRINSDLQMMKNTADWAGYVLSKDLEATPGIRTSINSGSGVILARIYQSLLKDLDLETYIQNELFDPMSIGNYFIQSTPEGSLNLTDGVKLETLDFAKLGYLSLLEGRWINKSRIIDRDWLLDTQTVVTVFNNNYGLGYGWWIFSPSFVQQRLPGATSCFLMSGGNGTNIYILPNLNMVVCISAENYYNSSIYNQSLAILFETLRTTRRETGNQ
ncbi:MAG: serine hydrolase [Cyclobacteriaceae bacterium]